jgi:hypothetical protein
MDGCNGLSTCGCEKCRNRRALDHAKREMFAKIRGAAPVDGELRRIVTTEGAHSRVVERGGFRR